MSNTVESYLMRRQPTAARPLLGLTVLLVEDSRFASEAVRLMCLRSGARIRRADCLASAHKHLRSYRPSVVIVDLGLPDGDGEEFIKHLATEAHPVQVILATSGDPDGETRAIAAGAQGFMEKPVANLGAFQQTILSFLPPESRPLGLRVMPDDTVTPDRLALQDDIAHVAELLSAPDQDRPVDYIAQFLSGVARSADDKPLCAAAEALGKSPGSETLAKLTALVTQRLENRATL
ncbi:MAG: response regulator [Pseudomonadota bacterium]